MPSTQSQLEQYLAYAKHIGADEYVSKWVSTVVKKYIEKNPVTIEEVEHILDYVVTSNKKVSKSSYDEAKSNAEKWMKTQIKKGNTIIEKPEDSKMILDFKDGFKVVQLIGENAYKREGFLMRHCVASYYGKGVEVYSLRDKDNMPHCTMEKDQQIKGKGNGSIHPNYVDYVVRFLKEIGMSVGDSEMKHLGYINIAKWKNELSKDTLAKCYGDYIQDSEELIGNDGEPFASLDLWDVKDLVSVSVEGKVSLQSNLAVFVVAAIKRLFAKKTNKKLNDEGGYYAQIGSSGNYAQIGSSGNYAQIGSSGDSARIGSSGYSARIGSSGDSAQIGSSGNYARIGSSGNYAQIGSSGDSARIGSSGYSARIGSSGDSAQIGSSGNYARIELEGQDSVGVSAGIKCTIKGKIGNWITLSEWKQVENKWKPVCVKSAQIDGKTIKEDTWYKLECGEFVEVKQ